MRLLASVLVAFVLAPAAVAGPGLIVGVDDDTSKWIGRSGAAFAVYRALGLDAVRVTLDWQPGQWQPTRTEVTELARVDSGAAGIRVVLAVTGPADAPPLDGGARSSYCGYVAGVLRRYPSFSAVVIWTEPNSARFWKPVSPEAYAALLAECAPVLHSARPGVTLLGASAARGSMRPATFWERVGAASGVVDAVGHNPYPADSSESPAATHRDGRIGEGDYARLVQALKRAFGRVPPIWYMEDGFQSDVSERRPLYRGTETDRRPTADQGAQLAAALRLAYCQPAVAAFFNFELVDERGLAGWQSGLLYADGAPKPAYAAFREVVSQVRGGAVACGG